MKASELRIGNWIADRGGKEWQINHWEGINKVASKPHFYMCMGVMTETHPLTEYVDFLKPIPLTEERLLSFVDVRKHNGFFSISCHYENDGSGILIVKPYPTGGYSVELGRGFSVVCETVHHFQNVVHAIANKELQLKEEIK